MIRPFSNQFFPPSSQTKPGLPVSDLDHGVNGLEFGDNGDLYIQVCAGSDVASTILSLVPKHSLSSQVGGSTNAGIPGALSSSGKQKDALFSAATLVAHVFRPGFNGNVQYDSNGDYSGNDVEIFASGQRNSYDITLHSNGHLYATGEWNDNWCLCT